MNVFRWLCVHFVVKLFGVMTLNYFFPILESLGISNFTLFWYLDCESLYHQSRFCVDWLSFLCANCNQSVDI